VKPKRSSAYNAELGGWVFRLIQVPIETLHSQGTQVPSVLNLGWISTMWVDC